MPLSSARFFFLLLCSFIFIQGTSLANERSFRWGKLSKEEKELKTVSYDKEAHAVVLGATGRLVYRGNMFVIEKHIRIKILDAEGTEEGNIAIPFYAKDGYENVVRLRGQTLEILPDGTIKKHKLEKNQVFETSLNDNWKEMRFALPAVKPGCVIEYSYSLTTQNFTFLEGWNFQSDIPTLYSSFRAEIPPFLQYYHLLQGHRLYKKYHFREEAKQAANEWSLENLPALKKEPYTFNLLDYAEKVRFQLRSYHDSNGFQKKVFADWQNISNKVLSHAMYRNYQKRNKEMDALTAQFQLSEREADDLQRIKKLYSYVQNTFTWNSYYGIIPDKELKDLMQEKSANGAAINLFLLTLLQKAGFEAYPALLSTKTHGRLNPDHPIVSQFNHTICVVKLDGRQIPLDAAGNLLPPGFLPQEDLNHTALILSEKSTDWLEIKDETKTSTLISYYANLPKAIHRLECRWTGYDAISTANQLQEKNFPTPFSSLTFSVKTDSTDIQKNIQEENSLTARMYLSEEVPTEYKADRIYYSLAVPDFLKENPFLSEERNLPVDFGHTSKKHLSYTIVLPEGFDLEEKPESIILKTPGNQASFTYQAGLLNGNLSVSVVMEINNPFFTVDQYPYLREFFNQVINRYQQPLVLVRSKAAH